MTGTTGLTSRHRRLAAAMAAVVMLATPVAAWASAEPVPGRPRVQVPGLAQVSGPVRVVVRLATPSLGEMAVATGQGPGDLRWHLPAVEAEQRAALERFEQLGAVPVAQLTTALNAVILEIDASRVPDLAASAGVRSVGAVGTYRTAQGPTATAPGSLDEALDGLAIRPLWDRGLDGSGVRIAVLDSGVDYTHADLGGPGTPDAWATCHDGGAAAAAPVGVCAGLFGPGAPRVEGGFDFIGETWGVDGSGAPVGSIRPDPNPIDREGHGTHVASIVAGLAPGSRLLAYKVCSAISRTCDGAAVLQAVDRALDPDGDGDLRDAVDVINLSLGTPYGQPQDHLSAALDNASRAGVVVVAAAGNQGEIPFGVSSPSTASEVISVGQTALPSDVLWPLEVTAGDTTERITNVVLQPWSARPDAPVAAPLAAPGRSTGCAADDWAGFPAGAIAIVDRGGCTVAGKAALAAAAGASALIVANDRTGAPPTFSAPGPVGLPVLSILLADGAALRSLLAAGPVTVGVDPAATVSIARTVMPTSSRGPSSDGATIKPDLVAPGAWVSADVATGSSRSAFGGTSGSVPVVAAVAALLLQQQPWLKPHEIRSLLMATAEPAIGEVRAVRDAPIVAAPVTRRGAGEVRGAPAAAAGVIVDSDTGPALSFGKVNPTAKIELTRTIMLRNTSPDPVAYAVRASLRTDGGARVRVPPKVTLDGWGMVAVPVTVTIDPSRLPPWPFAGLAGALGADGGATLAGVEVDGLVHLTPLDGGPELHVPWLVLPQRSSNVAATTPKVTLGPDGSGLLEFGNTSEVADGQVDLFAVIGTSPPLPEPGGPAGSNRYVVDLLAIGARDYDTGDPALGRVVEFALLTADRRMTPNSPASFELYIDTTGDTTPERVVLTQELGGTGATGQQVVSVLDPATGAARAVSYVITDLDSGVVSLPVPLSALGVDPGTTLSVVAAAASALPDSPGRPGITGIITDAIFASPYVIGSPPVLAEPTVVAVPAGRSATATVRGVGSVLAVYRAAARLEAELVEVVPAPVLVP